MRPPEILWQSSGGSDTQTDKIHTLINTAVIDGEYLYGIDSYGQARGLAVGTETSRTQLIEPTPNPGGRRRELGAVNWSHPAYANRHIFARNDKEILRASLAQD